MPFYYPPLAMYNTPQARIFTDLLRYRQSAYVQYASFLYLVNPQKYGLGVEEF